jgi:hypothetical protein
VLPYLRDLLAGADVGIDSESRKTVHYENEWVKGPSARDKMISEMLGRKVENQKTITRKPTATERVAKSLMRKHARDVDPQWEAQKYLLGRSPTSYLSSLRPKTPPDYGIMKMVEEHRPNTGKDEPADRGRMTHPPGTPVNQSGAPKPPPGPSATEARGLYRLPGDDLGSVLKNKMFKNVDSRVVERFTRPGAVRPDNRVTVSATAAPHMPPPTGSSARVLQEFRRIPVPQRVARPALKIIQ